MPRGQAQCGFTLIEILIFIVITGLLMSTLFVGTTVALRGLPNVHQQWVAVQTARRCMEWFLQQRRFNQYSSLTCPSNPTASACTAPSGFAVTTNITCTTWNSDSGYKTITVNVTGLATASLTAQIGDY